MARVWQPFYAEDEQLASGFTRAARFWNKPTPTIFTPPVSNKKNQDSQNKYTPPRNVHSSIRRPYQQVQKPFIIREHRTQTFLDLCKKTLITEEISLTMNKLSLLGLLFVLMFLGTVFFLSGFLVAVNVYNAKEDIVNLAQNHDPLKPPAHQPNKAPNVSIADGMPMNNGFKSGQPQYLVAPQYATVGGVPIIQQPRVPSHMQANMVAPDPNASRFNSTPPVHTPREQYQTAPSQSNSGYVATASNDYGNQYVTHQASYPPSYQAQ